MVLRVNLPERARATYTENDGRLVTPSAVRNAPAIIELVKRFAPISGQALEIASGTGQHIVELASVFSKLSWQPTELDPKRIESIKLWINSAKLNNIKEPIKLDVSEDGWSKRSDSYDFVILINLLHLISWKEVRTSIRGISEVLNFGGLALFYGPFMRNGQLTSANDREFHDELVVSDPEIGYKDDLEIIKHCKMVGLKHKETVQMPANNISFVLEKVVN